MSASSFVSSRMTRKCTSAVRMICERSARSFDVNSSIRSTIDDDRGSSAPRASVRCEVVEIQSVMIWIHLRVSIATGIDESSASGSSCIAGNAMPVRSSTRTPKSRHLIDMAIGTPRLNSPASSPQPYGRRGTWIEFMLRLRQGHGQGLGFGHNGDVQSHMRRMTAGGRDRRFRNPHAASLGIEHKVDGRCQPGTAVCRCAVRASSATDAHGRPDAHCSVGELKLKKEAQKAVPRRTALCIRSSHSDPSKRRRFATHQRPSERGHP